MTTDVAGNQGQEYHTNQTHFLAKTVTFANAGQTVTLGTLPENACVVSAGIIVSTAFNGSSPTADLGTAGDGDGFATALALGTIGNIVWDEFATSNDLYSTSATTVSVTLSAMSGASAGVGHAYVQYVVPNR